MQVVQSRYSSNRYQDQNGGFHFGSNGPGLKITGSADDIINLLNNANKATKNSDAQENNQTQRSCRK